MLLFYDVMNILLLQINSVGWRVYHYS